jgi:hypothetical protein
MIYFLSQQYATKNIFSDSKPPLVLQISSLTGNLQEHFSDNSLQWLLVEFGLIGFMGSILGIPFIRFIFDLTDLAIDSC